jgi:hypothetical protein
MNWKNILLPWSALKEAQKENAGLIQHGVEQAKKILKMEYEMKTFRLANVILKGDLNRLNATIDALPKRNASGRFTSRKPAEALRKPIQSLPQNEAK